MDQPGNKPVIFKLIAYTLMMFLVPILVYFVVTQHIGNLIEVAPEKAYIYGAVASIISVNCIILAYVVSAIREPNDLHED